MRETFSSLLASLPGKFALSLLVTSQHLIIPAVNAFAVTPVPLPKLNLDALGRVAFAGDFDSISLYEFAEQSIDPLKTQESAIYQRLPNGIFAKVAIGNGHTLTTDGNVKAMCAFQQNGQVQGFMVGGNFTSVNGQSTPGGVAMLNATTGAPRALPGLNGSINALLCDDGRGKVFVGGSFMHDNDNKNAIIWDGDWTDLPFKGFSGPVNSVVQAPNGNIVFGGQFDGLGNGTSGVAQNNTQSLPVGSANITSQTSSTQNGLSDPKTIACKTNPETQGPGNTWLLADNSPGSWEAQFGFGFQPTKLRLYNTNLDGRGTKTWRYTALPDGGIMNFTFVNPVTKRQEFCDARCPLPEGNTTAQDFFFVNQVGMNSFRIDISEWYGQGGGLNAIEVFQTRLEIFSYAINEFNRPSCGGVTTGASATATGSWISTPSHDSTSQYLTLTTQADQVDPNNQKVVFQPDIPQTGNYTIKLYTPGCRGDNTCATRGQVNITVNAGSSSTRPPTVQLFQTNEFDKYDTIYDGFIDASNGSPSVTLAPIAGQSTSNGVLTVVAQRVGFEIRNAASGGINGLFEFDPSKNTVDTDFSASVIDSAGASLTPSNNAMVTALASVGDNLFIGGNFSSGNGNNIFSIGKDANSPTTLSGNGLNGQVITIYADGNVAYVGGRFTNTRDNGNAALSGVAAYNNNQWQALGAGVAGTVLHLVPLSMNITGNTPEDVIGVTGFFSQVNGFNGNPAFRVDNFAIWVPSKNNWLANLNLNTPVVQGHLMTFATVPNGKAPMDRIYAGTISSGALGASGSAVLKHGGDSLSLGSFGAKIRAQQQNQASLRKRSITDNQNLNTTGVLAAIFYRENGMNKTILAGHFAATGSDGQNITDVLIIDGNDSDKITGFEGGIDSNSTIAAVAVLDNMLFAGGRVTGNVSSSRVGGLVSYNLGANNFANSQPPALQGTNVTVNAISSRPKSKDVYVAGNFDAAGALSCPALCIWNTERNQWTAPGASLDGVATSLFWVSDTKVLIAGNLTVGNNQTKIFSYDSSTSQFESIPGADKLPGPVTALAPANADGTQIWAAGQASDGSAFLQRFNGNNWLPVNGQFNPGTVIRGLQVLTLTQSHGRSDLIDNNQDLLVLGSIQLPKYNGTVSGAIFDGTNMTPFILTSTQDGQSGSLAQIFVENPSSFFQSGGKKLAVGFVVLIALAIALALTFLLVVAGIILEWYRKKAAGYTPAPTSYTDRMGNVGRVPPEQLFGTLSGPRAPAI